MLQKATFEGLQSTKLESLYCQVENALHKRLTTNDALYSSLVPYFMDASTRRLSGVKTAVGLNATGFANNMLASSCVNCPVRVAF